MPELSPALIEAMAHLLKALGTFVNSRAGLAVVILGVSMFILYPKMTAIDDNVTKLVQCQVASQEQQKRHDDDMVAEISRKITDLCLIRR